MYEKIVDHELSKKVSSLSFLTSALQSEKFNTCQGDKSVGIARIRILHHESCKGGFDGAESILDIKSTKSSCFADVIVLGFLIC